MDSRICAFCFSPFNAKRPSYPQKCCNIKCSNLLKAKITRDKNLKFRAPYEWFVESEKYGSKRAEWLAKKIGCSIAHVYRIKTDAGYEWLPRRTTNLHAPTEIERRYVGEIGCILCGEKRFVDAAHFVAARDGGSNLHTNMIPLCPTHHRLSDTGALFEKELKKFCKFLEYKYPRLSDLSQFQPSCKTFKNKGFNKIAAFYSAKRKVSTSLIFGAFVEVASEVPVVIRDLSSRKYTKPGAKINQEAQEAQPLSAVA